MSGPSVEGVRYEKHVYGIGADSYDTECIFIPSRQLSVSKDGSVFRTELPMQSKKVKTVSNVYLSECNSNKRPFDETEYNALLKKSDEEAKIKVNVPLTAVDEIEALIEKKAKLEAEMKEIDNIIKKVSQRLFH